MTKPIQVVVAVRAMWIVLAVNSVAILIAASFAPMGQGQLSAFHILVAVPFVVLIALVIRAAGLGRNGARITYAVIACLAILSSVSIGSRSSLTLAPTIFAWGLAAAYALILVCLFHPASNAWYRSRVVASAGLVAQAPTTTPAAKPIQITIAVAIMWIALTLNAAERIYTLWPAGQNTGAPTRLAITFVLLGAIALFIHFVSVGRGWARVVYAWLMGLAALLSSFSFVTHDLGSFAGIVALLNVGATLAILFLLFASATNAWFVQRRAERLAKGQSP